MDCRGKTLDLGKQTQVMGILNITPDSFSDGGKYSSLELAVNQALQIEGEGAAVLDIGGQSTRPGYIEVSQDEELSRVVPVVKACISKLKIPISIDSYRSKVADESIKAGASLVNDQHGFQGDPLMPKVVAEWGCPVVLMHWDKTLQAQEVSIIDSIKRFFEKSISIADQFGIERNKIILDPGIGFYKTQSQNLSIIAKIAELKSMGFPLLLGASRKSVIAHVLGGEPDDRLEGTLVTTALAAYEKVDLVRVHDVKANLRAIRMAEAVLNASKT
jgi:dihydropteroate synthase